MKFKFRLQKMLHFEEMKETMKRAEVAKALEDIRQLEMRQGEIERTLREVLSETPVRLHQGNEWVPYQVGKVNFALNDMKQVKALLEDTRGHLEVLQLELGRISMRRKALEDLRENKRGEFKLQESRKEQKRLDEVYRLTQRKEQ